MSTFGQIYKVTSWGESHGKGVGVVVDGCPPNIELDEQDIQKELDRRKPGQSNITTQRKEMDEIKIMSGVFQGKTTGTPISMMLFNTDQRPTNYDHIKDLFRPGHADYTYFKKYGIRDYRGGGRSSGRETVARVSAGAIAKKILFQEENVQIYAYTKSIGTIKTDLNLLINDSDCEIKLNPSLIKEIESNLVRTIDSNLANEMENIILDAKQNQNSVGGVVEVIAMNVPAGLGEPVFDKLDGDIAKALMSIGAVKGVEIGDGFKLSNLRGNQSNDQFINCNGKIITETNHAGGILGGISNGMPIVARVAVKPTASISQEQKTVNINGEELTISTEGRHDPCIVPRIVPVVESMIAITLCDHYLRQKRMLT